jgi:hypothetical protein
MEDPSALRDPRRGDALSYRVDADLSTGIRPPLLPTGVNPFLTRFEFFPVMLGR